MLRIKLLCIYVYYDLIKYHQKTIMLERIFLFLPF